MTYEANLCQMLLTELKNCAYVSCVQIIFISFASDART